MNTGRHKLWIAFWIGVGLIMLVLAWSTWAVYGLETRNALSRAENQRQEVIRLALWRMDSRLAPMIALEAARPVEDFETVFQFRDSNIDESALSSSVQSGDYTKGFFEIDQAGQTKGSSDLALEVASSTKDQRDQISIEPRSDGFSRNLDTDQDATPSRMESNALADESVMVTGTTSSWLLDSVQEPESDYIARQQIANLAQTNRARSKITAENIEPKLKETISKSRSSENQQFDELETQSISNLGMVRSFADDALKSPSDEYGYGVPQQSSIIGVLEPRWIVQNTDQLELVLMRTIERNDVKIVQGVWLDWDSIQAELITLIEDLLPTSTLEPMVTDPNRSPKNNPLRSYRLATVPVAFVPGGAIAVEGSSLSPAMLAMLMTWIAVIGAIIAVGLVLTTVLNLSSRRARFVGAVTHELRTPLTTFRLYSQMLADGMVTDEAVRKDYLNTLKRESDRLTGIVENVLEYARISRQGALRTRGEKPKGEQSLTVGELMARIVPPMSRLGEQAGMDLIVSDSTQSSIERTLTLDPHAVERIVMNLMDNACKYAGSKNDDEDRDLRVHLDASVIGDAIYLTLADHGPGVPGRDRRKIFGEFVRGSSGTMRDRSGLGLGLALSRGLALEMGGDLSLVRKRGHGAEFELRIPLDDS